MKKHIYVLDTNLDMCLYFGTAKKVHTYCVEQNYPIHKPFATFKKWLIEAGRYELLNIGYIIYQEIK